MIYQSVHSMNADEVKFEHGSDFSFPLHLHGSFELVTVTEGELVVTVDKTSYRISAGQAVLIFPNQAHSFLSESHSVHFLCIFSPTLVQTYGKAVKTKIPTSNIYTPSPFLLERLMDHGTRENLFFVKGLLYALCGEFDAGALYREREYGNEALLSQIFEFVERNYRADASLSALSAATSYHYVYLSKYFRECTGIPYAEYVSRYRVNEACYLLRNTDYTVLQIAYDCGFESLRSFNRNFKKILGIPPSEYRAR